MKGRLSQLLSPFATLEHEDHDTRVQRQAADGHNSPSYAKGCLLRERDHVEA